MKRTLFVNHGVGKAGEYRVASELMMRGHAVYFPAIDLGADLLIENGIRIQVKSCHLVKRNTQVAYFFNPSYRIIMDKMKQISMKDRKMSDEADFVIVWGIDENRFWVIPAELLDGKNSVSLGPECYFKETDLKKMLELRRLGKTHNEIAAEMGCSQTMVWALITGQREPINRYPDTKRIRDCEGRWDYLAGHLPQTVESTESAEIEEQVLAPPSAE